MALLTLYRVYDATANSTLASGIDNYEFALQTLELYRLEYPSNVIELETYTKNTVRPGFGRDPDLHK